MPRVAEHHLHYRCAFELAPVQPNERAWGDLVRAIRNWIGERIPQNQANAGFQGRWFYTGSEWRMPRNPRWYIKTARHVGSGSDERPQYWSLRWEHPCSDVASRQWGIDIGLTVRDSKSFVFSLTTTHWLMAGFLGKEPPSPVPSAPGIVTRLLSSRYWEAQAGSERLGTAPFLLREGNAGVLLKHLENVGRACPLVLIAKDFATGTTLLEPARLARLLAGAAVVWESESSWVDKELEILLEPGFRCWNGMVRVYQPRVKLNVADDAKRHRYFTGKEIQSLGSAAVEEALVLGVVRRARPVAFSEVITIDDVEDKQRNARLAELREVAKGSKEWTDFLEQDVERLESELKRQREENARIPELEDQAEDLREQIARLQYQHDQAISRAHEAESVRAALVARASVIDNLERLPVSISEVIRLIERAYPDRIVFTEKAKESASQATLKNFNVAFDCLRAMATTLYDLHFQQSLPLRDLAPRFRDLTGFELAVGESETTRKRTRLRALRKDVYKGEPIDVSPHVKHGTSPGNVLRVHYHVHLRDKLLVVGHCGDHLDTVRTN